MPRVLVADDEKALAEVCRRVIASLGFEVDTVDDGQKAFDRVQAAGGAYEMVVSDVKMPGLDGLELAARLRKRFPKIDVILMTGAPDLQAAVESLKAGAYDYLVKPLDIDVISACINRCWEKRQIADALNAEKSLRLELEAAYQELHRAESAKDVLLSRAGHELRTPLAVLLGNVELGMGEADAEKARVFFQKAQDSGLRLKGVINDLLTFADIAQGHLALKRAPTEFPALVRETVELCARVCAERKVTVAVGLEAAPPVVDVDPDRIRLALKHLILNAALFNKEGGRIMIGASREKDAVHLTVSDTGGSLEAAVVPQLFGSFYQAADILTRKVGGLGLGLAIVKGIVEGHGGWVRAEGGPEGAIFHVFLPLAAKNNG